MNPPIPWQPFDLRFRQLVDPTIMCLWWLPIRGEHEVFVGRAAYWMNADALMVRRRSGSAVCVRPGAFYAVITAPEEAPKLDDAINVSDSPASSQTPSALPLESGERLALAAPAEELVQVQLSPRCPPPTP